MRYLVGFVCVMALVALPQSASAQAGEEGTSAEPSGEQPAQPTQPTPSRLERWHPEAFVDPSQPASEPALKLEVDSTALEVTPSPPRTPDGYTLEEMDVRVRRAKIGVGVSGLGLVAGAVMGLAVLGASMCPFTIPHDTTCPPSWVDPVGIAGLVLGVGGLVGIVASGILLRKRKRDRDSLRYAHIGTPRRAQWDVARSRLVF